MKFDAKIFQVHKRRLTHVKKLSNLEKFEKTLILKYSLLQKTANHKSVDSSKLKSEFWPLLKYGRKK